MIKEVKTSKSDTPPPELNGILEASIPRYVRVTGTLNNRFVEFEFSIGDPELCVELVMQFDQFREFCKQHNAVELTAEQCAWLDYERLKWQFGQAGVSE
ncbi:MULTISPECIES: phenol hydroxylase subunit [unclassified Limnobacter]|uniref:phenol hydroxylase subunit n=1 Tax=unclassified Limnobacter TaxID=2630203 RepID=UPI000CF45A56|nr:MULTISPECIES: phenol hydroxylase subunit [unclassified Limnobacter]